MPRSWLIPGLLLVAFAVLSLGQQVSEERSDKDRIAQLEQQVKDLERRLVVSDMGGAVEIAPAILETRLAQIEMRLDRLEQQAIRSANPMGTSSDRMIDGRLRSLENAVMRLQQQR